jgi:ADP-ribose pyrophosphatase YjhB (NUDIX family)
MEQIAASDKANIKNISATVMANVSAISDNLPDEAQRKALRQDLAANLIKELNISMYGEDIKTVDGDKSFLVNKYGRTAAGATAVITMTDPDTNEQYVLLGRKYSDPKNPAAGLGQFICPGGYMNPQSPAKNKAEGSYDNNLTDAILREVKEETGLVFPKGYKPKSMGTNSDVDANIGVHTINEFYHFDLKGKPSDLPVQASDDLATLEWVNVKNIQKDSNIAPQPDGSNLSRYQILTTDSIVGVRDLHGDYVEKTIAQMQQNSLPSHNANDNNKWRNFVQSSEAKETVIMR